MTLAVYILLCLIWGSTWMAIKIGLSQAPPLYTAALRFLLAVLILFGIAFIRRYKYPTDLRTLVRLGYPGLYMYGLSYAMIYLAEQYIDSSLTAVLFGSFPFFVAVLSHWRLRAERLPSAAWLGLLVGFAGVVVISYQQWQLSGDLLLGTVLTLVGSYAAAHGLVLHTKYHVGQNIVVTASVQMTFGGLPLLPLAFIFEHPSELVISFESVGSIIYLAVFGSVVAFLGYYWLLRRTTAVVVSMIAFVTPLVAIFVGVVLFDEFLSLLVAIGTAMILSGMALVTKRRAKPVVVSGLPPVCE